MNSFLDGETIRIEGACHIVWDAYAQCERPTYPLAATAPGRIRGGCIVGQCSIGALPYRVKS